MPTLARRNLTYEIIDELIDYSLFTGILTWKVDPNNRARKGDICGYVDSHGYRKIKVRGYTVRAHHVAILLLTRKWPALKSKGGERLVVDHIDHDRQNNRSRNLRIVTNAENMRNQPGAKNYEVPPVVGLVDPSLRRKCYYNDFPTHSKRSELTKEELFENLAYNKSGGEFFHIETRHRATSGTVSGYLGGGYWEMKIKGDTHLRSHLVWLAETGEMPNLTGPNGEKLVVDHKDQDKTNDEFQNLRIITNALNIVNSKLRKNNKTGYVGVYEIAPSKDGSRRFVARIRIRGKTKFLGRFRSAYEGHLAYQKAIPPEWHEVLGSNAAKEPTTNLIQLDMFTQKEAA